MKVLSDLQLPQQLRNALQEAQRRISAEFAYMLVRNMSTEYSAHPRGSNG